MEVLNVDLILAMLHARVSGRGIDVNKVFVNAIHHPEDPIVIYSQTLAWAFYLKLQEGEVPYFEGDHLGLFSEAYTFEDQHRFKGMDLDEVNGLAATIAEVFLPQSAA